MKSSAKVPWPARHRRHCLLPAITSQASAHAQLPLLRVHWYDAAAQ